jgi:hypothetical protein
MLDGRQKRTINEMSGDEWEYDSIFINKTIRLVKSDGFILIGKILKINKNNLIFETDQATSLIKIDNIKELVLKKEGKK